MKKMHLEVVLLFLVAVVSSEEFCEFEQNEFVRVHNDLRSQVNPQASNMKYMVWDRDLAHSARLWSEECIWEHGQPDIDETYNVYGQNLYLQGGIRWSRSAEPSADRIIRDWWYNEVKDYTYDTNTCTPNKPCGHYTQVVWATSTKIGCGYAHCPTVEESSYTDAWLVTCNYYPPGNYRGVKPYRTGMICSQCTGRNVTCFNNLCRNCADPSPTSCISYEEPSQGIVLHFRGDSSHWWSRLEERVKSDLTTAVNNFCSDMNRKTCCPGDPSLEQWVPIEDFDMYTQTGIDDSEALFDVIAVPKLATEIQEQCEAVYLPNGVLPEAIKGRDLTSEWRENNLILSNYAFAGGNTHENDLVFSTPRSSVHDNDLVLSTSGRNAHDNDLVLSTPRRNIHENDLVYSTPRRNVHENDLVHSTPRRNVHENDLAHSTHAVAESNTYEIDVALSTHVFAGSTSNESDWALSTYVSEENSAPDYTCSSILTIIFPFVQLMLTT